MNASPKTLWDSCLQLIKENVTEQQFDTWFRPIVLQSYKPASKTLLVQVPSQFVYEYLEGHYVDLLRKVLTRVFGQGVQLTYRVMVDQENHLSQDLEQDTIEDVASQRPTARANQSPTVLDTVPQDLDSQLDPHKSFSNYVEGDSNKLPRSIGLSIAEHPNTTQFNPMFIYGPSGCGKTHLINAIGLRASSFIRRNVCYMSLLASFRCSTPTLFDRTLPTTLLISIRRLMS